MRKLASVRKISNIKPIKDADAIECAQIDGWDVVVKKGEFSVGDSVVYFEIDSWIPNSIAPFLSKGQEPKEYEGVKGERLRTVRLRGQLSQGLILPLCEFDLLEYPVGTDLTDILNIKKYEPPIPAQLSGEVKGLFPTLIPKTDQERVQNILDKLVYWTQDQTVFEVTEKLDGSSMTCYYMDGEFGVCSRNLDLKRNTDNSLWKAALNQKLDDILSKYGKNIALQGELIGEGIQGNPYKLKGQQFYLFDVYLISEGRYMDPTERKSFAVYNNINHVPIIDYFNVKPVDELLLLAEGKSVLNVNTEREGLVFKSMSNQNSFKVISNKFLLKNGG